jgi:NAD+ kinase
VNSPTPQTVAVVPAREKDEARELVPAVKAWLRERGCEVRGEDDLRGGARADMLVALGGDGLMMRMAHSFPNLPLLGINFGKVGFLAMVERAQWQSVLGAVLDGDYQVLDGPTLVGAIRRGPSRIDGGWAINDVVLRAGLRMIEVELYVDGHYVNTYPGDGMIVASPQGSTAYCMAAGGPIITAGVRGFALTPISAHSPIRATLVVPEESTIELVLTNDHAAELIMDGLPVEHLRRGDVLTVTRGDERFRLIVTGGMNFYEAFRSKFNYLIRPDAVPSLGVVRQPR